MTDGDVNWLHEWDIIDRERGKNNTHTHTISNLNKKCWQWISQEHKSSFNDPQRNSKCRSFGSYMCVRVFFFSLGESRMKYAWNYFTFWPFFIGFFHPIVACRLQLIASLPKVFLLLFIAFLRDVLKFFYDNVIKIKLKLKFSHIFRLYYNIICCVFFPHPFNIGNIERESIGNKWMHR